MRSALLPIVPGDILDLLGDSLDEQVAYVGADLTYRFANSNYLARFSRPPANIRGKSMQSVLGNAFDIVKPYVDEVLKGEPIEFEVQLPMRNGQRTMLCRYIPDADPHGEVRGFLKILRDITEERIRRSVAERTLTERAKSDRDKATWERRFRAMLDQSPLGIQVYDTAHRCLFSNAGFASLFENESGKDWNNDIFGERQLATLGIPSMVVRALSDGVTEIPAFYYEPARSGRRGRARWIRGFAIPIPSEKAGSFESALTLIDVTDEVEKSIELSASEERFRHLIDASLDAVVSMNDRCEVVEWAAKAEKIFGYKRKEAIGAYLYDLIVPENLTESFKEGIKRYLETGAGPLMEKRTEIVARHKSGRQFPVELSVAAYKQGDEVLFAGYVMDISARKRAEEEMRRVNAELEQRVADRIEAFTVLNRELEAFAYSVAHELRSPLRRVSAVAKILQDENGHQLDKEGQARLYEIREFCAHMSRLITDHLEYARLAGAELKPARIDLSKLVWSLIRELQPHYTRTDFRVNMLPNQRAKADPEQLRVAILNLLDNAAKFSAKTAKPVVEFGRDIEGRYYVRDNGIGYDPEFANKLFTPFERLHHDPQYPGTGVGLANVKRIIERANGTVSAESQPGNGATFYFTLP